MQVIAVPVGASPPDGAVPMAPTALEPSMLQMIALPVGQAPPEGAVPVDAATAAALVQGPAPPHQSQETSASNKSRAFKIKDPQTGQEIRPLSDKTAAGSRRMRIVNP